MSRFTIFKANGMYLTEGNPKFVSSFGQPDYLEFSSISSPTPLNFGVGCYVDYESGDSGLGYPNRYELYNIPQVTKQARSLESGESFVYSNVQFFAPTKMLERTLFRDIVKYDNQIHFSTRETISTYETVSGIAARIEACMNANNSGIQWHIQTVSTTDTDLKELLGDTRNFSMSAGSSCLEALNEIYNLWKGIGWVYEKKSDGHYIYLGKPNLQTSENTTGAFLYGKGLGLKLIKKSISSAEEFATRLYAYGSTRNLISRYYNSKNIYNAESVNIPNLMIPLTSWGQTDNLPDGRKAYIEDADAISKFGLIEKVAYFDGNGDNKEIYPSIEGMTIGDIRALMSSSDEYYPRSTYLADRVDEIKGGSSVADNGVYMDTLDGSDVFASGESDTFNVGSSFSVADIGRMVSFDQLLATMTVGSVSASGKLLLRGEGWNIKASFSSNATPGMIYGRAVVKVGGVKVMTIPADVGYDDDGNCIVYFLKKSLTTYSGVYTTTGAITVDTYLYGEFSTSTSPTTISIVSNLDAPHCEWKCKFSLAETFEVITKQIGFDIAKQATTASTGIGTLNMNSGKCAGRSFAIKSTYYNSVLDAWVLTCYRQKDTDISQYFPNSDYQIAINDRFVLTDIIMPNLYVLAAENRLLAEAQRTLASMCKPKYVYEPEIDPIFHKTAKDYLTSGRYMTITDTDVVDGNTDYILIDSVTITYGDDTLPTVRVTLRDEKASNFFQKTFRQQNQTKFQVIGIKSQIGNANVGGNVATKSDEGSVTMEGVTSVGLASTATGLKVAGSPITETGTFILSFESGYGLMTDTEKAKIANMATLSDIPTKVSDLTNDEGFIDKTEADSYYAPKATTYSKNDVKSLLGQKLDKSALPANLSGFNNDLGFITDDDQNTVVVHADKYNESGELVTIGTTYGEAMDAFSRGKSLVLVTDSAIYPVCTWTESYQESEEDTPYDMFTFASIDGYKVLNCYNLRSDIGWDWGESFALVDDAQAYSIAQQMADTEGYIKASDVLQSDWNVTNASSKAYIKNKPTIPTKTSQLTNDSTFLTRNQADSLFCPKSVSYNYIINYNDSSEDYQSVWNRINDGLNVIVRDGGYFYQLSEVNMNDGFISWTRFADDDTHARVRLYMDDDSWELETGL